MTMSVYFNDHSTEADHGRRSLRSGAVVVGARVLVICIQVLTVLILARLLSPEDYGLVAMVTAITAFAPMLVSLGTPDPVVQRAHITEKEISALFWISVAFGSGVAALMAASGPLIARFYGEPRLTSIASVSALTFVVSALSSQHNTLLRRAMKFKDLAAVEVCSNLLAAVGAIAMALYGLEYWALVLRPLLTTSFIALGSWLRCRWVPGRPAMSVGAKAMLRQGLHCTGFFITDYIAGYSSDRIMIGYRSGPVQLGYYQNAVFIYDNLNQLLVLSAHNVAVASLGKARNDLDELLRLWRKALSTLAFYAMPAFGILAVTGQDLIPLLLGSKWTHSGVIISILALRGIPQSVERTNGWLHVVAGRTDRWIRWGLVAMCAQLTALFCGLPYGPTGVATAFVVYSFVIFIPAIAYSGAPLNIRAMDVIAAVWRPQIAALLAVAIGFTLRFTLFADLSLVLRIIMLSLAYAAAYLTIVVGLLHERMPIQVFLALVREVESRFVRAFGLS
jgi:PST family polysaccharide transporter